MLGPDRKSANAFARGGEDGVCHGGSDRWCAGFADPTGGFVAGHQINFDHRHFVDAQHFICVEISLLHTAFVYRDTAFEGREAEDDAALELLFDARGVDHLAAILGANDAMDTIFSFAVDRDFGDLRVEAAEAVDGGDTVESSRG